MAHQDSFPIIRRKTKLSKGQKQKSDEVGSDEEQIPPTQLPQRKRRLFAKPEKNTSIYDPDFFGDFPEFNHNQIKTKDNDMDSTTTTRKYVRHYVI